MVGNARTRDLEILNPAFGCRWKLVPERATARHLRAHVSLRIGRPVALLLSLDLMRLAAPIGEIASTPGAVTIQKTKHDITIVCSKPGYVDATYMNHSGVAGATFANILGGVITGGIAWGIDSASGADNKYEGQVN